MSRSFQLTNSAPSLLVPRAVSHILSQPKAAKRPQRTKHAKIRYGLRKGVYRARSISAIRQQFLSRIVTQQPFGTRFSPVLLYRILNRIANILLMNEFEISLWALFIDQLSETEKSFQPTLLLYFTGYAAKSYFNEDICIYEPYSNLLIPHFIIKYSNWLCMTNCNFDASYSQIFGKYNQLSAPHSYSEGATSLYDLQLPRKCLLPSLEDSRSETSTLADLEMKLEIFEQDTLGGEKLEPIEPNSRFP